MFKTALQLIVEAFNAHMSLNHKMGGTNIVLGNAGYLDVASKGDLVSETETLKNKLVLSLINIEQERLLKNLPRLKESSIGKTYKNPPAYFNLFVLITANYGHGPEGYAGGLQALSYLTAFFQAKQSFALRNFPAIVKDRDMSKYVDLEIELELVNTSLEEVYHLWGVLGGKILPSVMYRVRLVPIEEDLNVSPVGEITQIESEVKHKRSGN